jgi:hypothetical protein
MKAKRFIYAYRERSTGRAVYVGSTFNVKKRHYSHCCGNANTPFDLELAKKGRDVFTLETLEAVAATKTVERENYWMDALGTFRTTHGFNTIRAHEVAGDGDRMKTMVIRLTEEQATKLADRKKRTLVPTEAFVRSLIEQALKAEKTKP